MPGLLAGVAYEELRRGQLASINASRAEADDFFSSAGGMKKQYSLECPWHRMEPLVSHLRPLDESDSLGPIAFDM